MATTGMCSVKSRLDYSVNYVSNPLKTVTQYVINEEKKVEKRYVKMLIAQSMKVTLTDNFIGN